MTPSHTSGSISSAPPHRQASWITELHAHSAQLQEDYKAAATPHAKAAAMAELCSYVRPSIVNAVKQFYSPFMPQFDDAVQDAYCRFIAGIRKESGSGSAYAYAYMIAYRSTLQMIIKGNRTEALGRQAADIATLYDDVAMRCAAASAATLPPIDEALDRVAELSEDISELATAVTILAEPYRTAAALRYIHGLSYTEIASRLNITNGTARKRIQRARAMIAAQCGLDATQLYTEWHSRLPNDD